MAKKINNSKYSPVMIYSTDARYFESIDNMFRLHVTLGMKEAFPDIKTAHALRFKACSKKMENSHRIVDVYNAWDNEVHYLEKDQSQLERCFIIYNVKLYDWFVQQFYAHKRCYIALQTWEAMIKGQGCVNNPERDS